MAPVQAAERHDEARVRLREKATGREGNLVASAGVRDTLEAHSALGGRRGPNFAANVRPLGDALPPSPELAQARALATDDPLLEHAPAWGQRAVESHSAASWASTMHVAHSWLWALSASRAAGEGASPSCKALSAELAFVAPARPALDPLPAACRGLAPPKA
eukprot:CAMPEP_0183520254 /NCGR_PEP_ID=MMETSP0371-20130417/16778_1 /TAXON_ID=268820 /ORGANISM="Peridinium aciculiferum, Strain PAER-2" /LENGTH=161 /DNA_ID=CAMNT_0025718579 /DNA_START=369 /DNA_END=852 /DNA_ORIENTATION=-